MNEFQVFAWVFAAVTFCPVYSCYMSVFLSQIHTNCAAISNITSCLSEWRSLCHKYFIMPLGICPRPLKTRTQTLLFDFSALKFQWVYSQSVAGVRKHSVSCLMVFVEDSSVVLIQVSIMLYKNFWTIFLIYLANLVLFDQKWWLFKGILRLWDCQKTFANGEIYSKSRNTSLGSLEIHACDDISANWNYIASCMFQVKCPISSAKSTFGLIRNRWTWIRPCFIMLVVVRIMAVWK